MQKSFLATAGLALATLGIAAPAHAHDVNQVRYELRERGYHNIRFIVAEAPFQVNACRGGERYHLHVNWYGNITSSAYLGHCGYGNWNGYRPHRYGFNRRYDAY